MSSLSEQKTSEDISSPNIAIDTDRAFFPYHKDEEGKVRPAYHSRICANKILGVCTRWEMKIVYPDIEWLYLNDWGACKRPRPTKL